jgi:hypothetical protein
MTLPNKRCRGCKGMMVHKTIVAELPYEGRKMQFLFQGWFCESCDRVAHNADSVKVIALVGGTNK